MKARRSLRFLPQLVVIAVASSGISLAATSQYWNIDGTGGDGNWGTSLGDRTGTPPPVPRQAIRPGRTPLTRWQCFRMWSAGP